MGVVNSAEKCVSGQERQRRHGVLLKGGRAVRAQMESNVARSNLNWTS